MHFLTQELIQLDAKVNNAKEAIEQAGKLLLDQQLINESYIQAMIDSYEQNGPYFVLAPHIALPHARPEDGAKQAAVSMLQLKKPVPFGHPNNDPVSLVFALAAGSNNEHILVLKKLSTLLGNEEIRYKFMTAKNYEDLQSVIEGD
ncbi:PTS system mannitol-specific IIA component/PTS system ascorbate-specific IIA component [Caldalkalibacillus uzonensis]|uniref:PTS system mannitol-specific IIA component/PTS system ascorbate-specific IIA component n=1 Tax=Caldalkalibacillus uzonensis TaxID=353224 RepID=A0ABU0CSE1_9BACI|nr:PTS sugar transporter subunit IIA [Caldalkalibacillus uzonensis]MDQ0339336.1 PTS system mannitol-specific IIA component/PTS system ascorbate-specific IIA component [Caldalkalibacillus uzonensis]